MRWSPSSTRSGSAVAVTLRARRPDRLSRAIVAQRVGELIDAASCARASRAEHRRPAATQLTFSADAGHVLVADLGATSIDVAVTSLDGRILGHHDEPADIAAGPRRACSASTSCSTSCARDPSVPARLWGVGIGVPGPVEFRRDGRSRRRSCPAGTATRSGTVRCAYDAPVWVDNDVNVLALGEWRSGIAVGHDNVVVVKIGTGIGAGIISDGRLHRGAQGSAGDVGHIQVVDDASVVCRCGNIGCLEALSGGAALARSGMAAAREGRSERLMTAPGPARNGDRGGRLASCVVWRRGCRGAAPVRRPAGRAHACERRELLQSVADRDRRRCPPRAATRCSPRSARRSTGARFQLATRDLLIQRSSLGRSAGVIGASAMVVDQLFSRESIARWMDVGGPSGMPEVAVAAR
jgi:predicted NBD/HSP70 family sugar kinase